MGLTRLEKQALRPVAYPRLRRLGPSKDGGYVVPEDQIAACHLLVSLGLSDNWEFDKGFAQLNPSARILGVDHTVGRRHFLQEGARCLWRIPRYVLTLRRSKLRSHMRRFQTCVDYFLFFRGRRKHLRRRVTGRVRDPIDVTLGEILKSSSSSSECDVFLKMDIEGCEYEVVPEIIENAGRIRSIVAEFHELDKRTDVFNQAIRNLARRFLIIHIHGNNWGPYDAVADFPVTVEITFVNKALVPGSLSPSTVAYPRPGLDYPSDELRPDYELHFGGA